MVFGCITYKKGADLMFNSIAKEFVGKELPKIIRRKISKKVYKKRHYDLYRYLVYSVLLNWKDRKNIMLAKLRTGKSTKNLMSTTQMEEAKRIEHNIAGLIELGFTYKEIKQIIEKKHKNCLYRDFLSF